MKTVDETGFHIRGKTYWLHVMGTDLLTHYRTSPKRKDLESMAGIQGIVVHDHWKSYLQLKNVKHSLCNADHLRELKALIEIEKEGWVDQMMRLLQTVVHLKDPQIDRIYKLHHRIIKHGLAYHHSLPPNTCQILSAIQGFVSWARLEINSLSASLSLCL